MSPVQQRRDDHEEGEQEGAADGDRQPHGERGAPQPPELRARQVEGSEGRDEGEQPGRDPARVPEGVEQRVVLEAGEHELGHLAARLLHVARVGAEEADQRRVGQRGEHEPGDEHDRERPDADHARGDDGGRLAELAELVDELRLGGYGAAARALRLGAGRFGLGARPRRRRVGLRRLGVRLRLGPWLRRRRHRRGWGRCLGCGSRDPRRAAVRAEPRAVLQLVAALVAERHPGPGA